jgi:uncharacterized repeat protein (TIGR03803 family)
MASRILGMRLRAGRALGLAVILALVILATPSALAQTFQILYSFNGNTGGANPYTSLVQDPAGNLYGTTSSGGSRNGWGTVYVVSLAGSEKVLQSFNGMDGINPYVGLIRDPAGNLYGTTVTGGSHGDGTVFVVSKSGNGSVLHSFIGKDGSTPYGGLVRDAAGNLYGTTSAGGAYGFGTVFAVNKAGNENVLYSFSGGADGSTPYGGLVEDAAGNLYGTTNDGGAYGFGTIFVVNKIGNEEVLYSFTGGDDGAAPRGGLVLDDEGNLYGTTEFGGDGYGTVFVIHTTDGRPTDTESVLYTFTGGEDGGDPRGGVILDDAGNLYGTTYEGGANGVGTVFMVDPAGNEQVLHSFNYTGGDGQFPAGGLLLNAGNLYGTTVSGGTIGFGTVFVLQLAPRN